MQSSEFLNYFDHFPHLLTHYKGIYSINTLPKSLKLKNFLICNTAPSQEEGEHWFVIFKAAKSCVEVFDSLGINEVKENILIKNLSLKTTYLTFNETEFQDHNSISCGHFCIYFAVNRFFNLDLDFDEFLQEFFELNQKTNETIVTQFCDDILKDKVTENELIQGKV